MISIMLKKTIIMTPEETWQNINRGYIWVMRLCLTIFLLFSTLIYFP